MQQRVIVDRAWLTRLFIEGERINLAVATGLPKHARLVGISIDGDNKKNKKDTVTLTFQTNRAEAIEVRYE